MCRCTSTDTKVALHNIIKDVMKAGSYILIPITVQLVYFVSKIRTEYSTTSKTTGEGFLVYPPILKFGSVFEDLIVIPCNWTSCLSHAGSTPSSLFDSIFSDKFAVMYVVSGGDDPHIRGTISKAVPGVHFLVFNELMEHRPPVRKEFEMLRTLRALVPPLPFVIKVDMDTVLNPKLLRASMTSLMRERNDVFSGPLLSGCGCYNISDVCTYSTAVPYCAGYFYITNSPTLMRIPYHSFVESLTVGDSNCHSSDMSVGHMMHSELGLVCSPFVTPGSTDMPSATYPLSKSGRREKTPTSVCHQYGFDGGMNGRHVVPSREQYADEQLRRCVAFHPAKSAHDIIHMWNAMSGTRVASMYIPRYMPGEFTDLEGNCTAAIYIVSRPQDVNGRNALRLTWVRHAYVYGMVVRFVVGIPTGMEWIGHAVRAEMSIHGDVLIADVEEGYRTLPFKTAYAIKHFTANCNCRVFVKTDMETYIRPYQLLKEIEMRDQDMSGMLYMGHMWNATSSGKPNVVKDISNPWYLGYDAEYYPAYMSGYLYVIGRRLASGISECVMSFRHGPEDVQVGLCVDAIKHSLIVNSPNMATDRPCSISTVAIGHHTRQLWNVFSIHEAELGSVLCKGAPTEPSIYKRQYGVSVGGFDDDVTTPSVEMEFIHRILPPWEVINKSPRIIGFESPSYYKEQYTVDVTPPGIPNWLKHERNVKTLYCPTCGTGDVLFSFDCGVRGVGRCYQIVQYSGRRISVSEVRHVTNNFDILIPFGCGDKHRLGALITRLRIVSPDSYIYYTNAIDCPGNVPDIQSIHRLKRVDINTFARAVSIESMVNNVRPDSVVIIIDVDMEIDIEFMDHASMFVTKGSSAYFPIVFSMYPDNSLETLRKVIGRKPYLSESGKWRPWGYGMFAMHSSDISRIHFDTSIQDWGGEDDDFFHKSRRFLNIVRHHDISIRHLWHEKDCSHVQRRKKVSCVMSKYDFEGPPISLIDKAVLKNELS